MYRHDLIDILTIQPKIPIDIIYLNEQTIERILEVKMLNLKRLTERLRRGDICFASISKSSVISYHWLQTSGYHFIQQSGKTVKVKSNEGYVYHVRVDERYRGNRINGFVYSKILQHCKREGLENIWVYTNINNLSNRKGLVALGFLVDHYIYSLKFGQNYYQIYKDQNK